MVKSQEMYAGFWVRAVALCIDAFIVGIPTGIASYFLFPQALNPATVSQNPQIVLVNQVFTLFCYFVYFGILQAFMGGTLGKRILGLKIVAADFGPASFGQCIGRYFASWISSLVFGLGFLWAGFSGTKRAWHDSMAGTYVVKQKYLAQSKEQAPRMTQAA